MARVLALQKSINLTTEIENFKNPYVRADKLHTNEVIINLISNAIKYTKNGGKVSFDTEQIGDPVDGRVLYRFTVSDNGIGMSEEFQEHLFEAFSREQSSAVSKIEGSGLGLSIVKRIVDMIGGTITVNSKPGEGSSFIVEMPFELASDEEAESLSGRQQIEEVIDKGYDFSGTKVLLVEDNEMNREIGTEILQEAGFIVESAEDGEVAVQIVKEKGTDYYDFILMDIQMPIMNGYEATAEIRRLPGGDKVPIVALSANAFEEDVKNSLAAGMNAHVAKPIDVKSLFGTLRKVKK